MQTQEFYAVSPLNQPVPATYLEHAEYMYITNNPYDIYQVDCDLFNAYLDMDYYNNSNLCRELWQLPLQTLIDMAILMAAVHGEI